MPQEYSTRPGWARKRKLSEEPLHPSIESPSVASSAKRSKTGNELFSTKPSATYDKVDKVDKVAKDLRKWMLDANAPEEDCFRYVQNIVNLCHAEEPGERTMNKIVARYRSIGATQEHVDELYDSLQPFWTRAALRNVASSITNSGTIADAMRTILTNAEEHHGQLLDPLLRADLASVLNRIDNYTAVDMSDATEATTFTKSEATRSISAKFVETTTAITCSPSRRPVLHVSTDAPTKSTTADSHEFDLSRKPSLAETASVGMLTPMSAPSLAHEAHSLNAFKLAQSPTRRPKPRVNLPRAVEGLLTDSCSPSASKTSTPPSPDVFRRLSSALPQTGTTGKRPKDVCVTPTSESVTRRTSCTTSSSFNPPIGPLKSRSYQSGPFEAKVWPPEKFTRNKQAQQGMAVREACDKGGITGVENLFHQDDRSWLLRFKNQKALERTIGLTICIWGVDCEIRPHYPGQKFQMFAAKTDIDFHSDDMIDAVGKSFCPARFSLQKQRQDKDRRSRKWIICFEEPIEKDNLDVEVFDDEKRRNAWLSFYAVSPASYRCFVCVNGNHITNECDFLYNLRSRGGCQQYLDYTPEIKDSDMAS